MFVRFGMGIKTMEKYRFHFSEIVPAGYDKDSKILKIKISRNGIDHTAVHFQEKTCRNQ